MNKYNISKRLAWVLVFTLLMGIEVIGSTALDDMPYIAYLEYNAELTLLDFKAVNILADTATVGVENRTIGEAIAVAMIPPINGVINVTMFPGELNDSDEYWLVIIANGVTVVEGRIYVPPAYTAPVRVDFVVEDDVQLISGELVQIIPHNSEAVAPVVYRKGWVFDEWDMELENVTYDIIVFPIWLRLGNVSMGGRGNVTSADVVWLARHIAGHAGFGEVDERVADINGDGLVDSSDITALLRWLVGYDLYELRA
ncbi:MAG: dockerin type I repeat-containing protein [Defluviitaleaceae bacterium]|nr:dockerin type I repeat-containing protein [Defluviitaleaceae bacterium]